MTYHSQHALVFSDGPTTPKEANDHNNYAHGNEDVCPRVQHVEMFAVVDIFAEVLVH